MRQKMVAAAFIGPAAWTKRVHNLGGDSPRAHAGGCSRAKQR
jgi:hypothetical protein